MEEFNKLQIIKIKKGKINFGLKNKINNYPFYWVCHLNVLRSIQTSVQTHKTEVSVCLEYFFMHTAFKDLTSESHQLE